MDIMATDNTLFPLKRDPCVHVVVYSGGMDSFTLLRYTIAQLMQEGDSLMALSFDYGQRHRRELEVAKKVCRKLGVAHHVIDLSTLRPLLPGSALTDKQVDVPHGHYEAESMKKTVVPGRNTLMLSIALAAAEGQLMRDDGQRRHNAYIYFGAHAGDHHIYPDCRPQFVAKLADAFREASEGRVMLMAPFEGLTKGGILGVGATYAGLVALDYADTHTCYEGTLPPCGKCGACQERAEAFALHSWEDPLVPVEF